MIRVDGGTVGALDSRGAGSAGEEMKRYFDQLPDYHYDNSGYYGYIVFNGGRDELNKLLTALGRGEQPDGLGWYRYGKSFRPANDNNTYDYYIRLYGGGESRPNEQRVDEFLRKLLSPMRNDHREQDKDASILTKPPPIALHPSDDTPTWAIEIIEQVLGIRATLHDDMTTLREDTIKARAEMTHYQDETRNTREQLAALQKSI